MDTVLSFGGLLGSGTPEPPPPPPPTGIWAYLPESFSSSTASPSSSSSSSSWFSSEPETADPCLRLGYAQRMACFAIAFVAGVACCVMASLVVFSPHLFAKYYSLGSLLLLGSTFFLIGPVAQLKSMFHPSRYIASILYLGTLIGTLYAASVSNILLTMVLVVVQICAALWYVASYIPYAQDCLWGTAQRVLPV
mmetsp:Transcript_2409/g.7651  ORF Transcript_2409/g.7651 Transcript_2409/m.7651 type:complete len:194 (-) Transcript_2409:44-625(-)